MILNYINSNKNEFFDNAKVTFDTLSTNFKDTLAYLKRKKVQFRTENQDMKQNLNILS